MLRDLLNNLMQWKSHPLRMPLILRGARQVGKSWLVKKFSESFPSYVELNLEKNKEIQQLFAGTLDINNILTKISLYCGKKIIPGETLLFLDEIQECENALKALRYFKEECPALHIIAAGSLLEFSLRKIGIPVGRIQFMYLYPLSFGEFLTAIGRQDLREFAMTQQTDPVIHPILNEHIKSYMWLGGMPAVVAAWLEFQDIKMCQELQDHLITAYKQDFLKYAKKNQIEYVSKIFSSIPARLGIKFKYTNVDNEINTFHLKKALSLLVEAGIVYQCFHTSGQSIPLGADKNEKKFKPFFLDIGLAQRIIGLNLSAWTTQPLAIKYLGNMAEQFVAQELTAYSSITSQPELYYWHREAKNSNAEIDFIVAKEQQIIPIEVKSGVKGGMKSLNVFLSSHPQIKTGLKISEGKFLKQPHLDEIPFYGLEGWLKNQSVPPN